MPHVFCWQAYAPSTYTHYAQGDGVHALFAGEVSQWPGIDIVSSQHDGATPPCYKYILKDWKLTQPGIVPSCTPVGECSPVARHRHRVFPA